jgi:DNA polymerase-3 subunit delta
MPDRPDILTQIEAGKTAAVYYLCGEPFPLEQVVKAIHDAVLGGEASAFNFDALRADEHGADAAVAAARTMPMFGSMRLVQVREAHLWRAEELERLLPYVKNPSPSTCLLLLAEKADLRLKFFNQLKKHGVVQRFEPLKERQVPAWVSGEARRHKIKLMPNAAERIADAVGTDMGQLSSALERLSLYVGPGKPVSPDDVDDLLARTRQRSIFELTNAVGRGQRRESLLVLRKMLQDREPPVRILVMMARHVRLMWSAKELAQRGESPKAIASKVGIHPYFVQDMLRQASRFSEEMLVRMHRALFETDRQLKSSRLADEVVLERLVMRLCPS